MHFNFRFSMPPGGLLISALLLFGCAASSPVHRAESTIDQYFGACEHEQPEKASQMLRHPNAQIDPCPEATFRNDKALEMMAIRNDTQFEYQNGQWRLQLDQRFLPNSLHLLLFQLKYALKSEDVSRFLALVLPSAHRSSQDVSAWISSSQANDLYAAIAAHPNPWFQIVNQQAICEVSGITLTFQVENGRWYFVPEHF